MARAFSCKTAGSVIASGVLLAYLLLGCFAIQVPISRLAGRSCSTTISDKITWVRCTNCTPRQPSLRLESRWARSEARAISKRIYGCALCKRSNPCSRNISPRGERFSKRDRAVDGGCFTCAARGMTSGGLKSHKRRSLLQKSLTRTHQSIMAMFGQRDIQASHSMR